MKLASLTAARAFGAALVLVLVAVPAFADVPLASRNADRAAKSAVPRAGEVLVYVYWQQQSRAAPLAVTLNGRETARLAPGTFVMWRVKPGRAVIGAEGTTSTLALRADGGRVYYIALSRSAAGVTMLRQVPFPTGRTQIHHAKLVAQTATAAAPARAAPTRAAATPRTQRASNVALSLKAGSFKLAEDSQPILGSTRVFESSASSVVGLEGEWFMRPNLSLGLELVSYSSDFTTPPGSGGAGSTDTVAVLLNVKRYFAPASAWQPYIGIGGGGASIDFSGAITGSTGGAALQVVGGLQWRGDRLALRAEYKYLSAETEDDNNQKVDASGSGVFLGVGVYF